MKNLTDKSIGILVMSIVSILIIYFVITSEPNNDNQVIFNTSPQMDTVEVIIEWDGDREIRWYTLVPKDTIEYQSIDTTIIHWPWGREEFYYFRYKNDTSNSNNNH
tara:strand:- start:347 stop:664 length:318 start_codon:yes stop_codon:yes gene_type:complete